MPARDSLFRLCLTRILSTVCCMGDRYQEQLERFISTEPSCSEIVAEIVSWPQVARDALSTSTTETEWDPQKALCAARLTGEFWLASEDPALRHDPLLRCSRLSYTPWNELDLHRLRTRRGGDAVVHKRVSDFLRSVVTVEDRTRFERQLTYGQAFEQYMHFHRHLLVVSRGWTNTMLHFASEAKGFALRWDAAMLRIDLRRDTDPSAYDFVGEAGSHRRRKLLDSTIVREMNRSAHELLRKGGATVERPQHVRHMQTLADCEHLSDRTLPRILMQGCIPSASGGAVQRGIGGHLEGDVLYITSPELPEFYLSVSGATLREILCTM